MALRPLLVTIKRLWLILAVWVIWALWGLLILFAAYHDGVLWLPAAGRGLLEHYSFWASFFVGPALLTATYYARRPFLQFSLDAVEQYATEAGKEIIRSEVKALAERSQRAIIRYVWLIPLMILGIQFSIRTYHNLEHPLYFWGNDVFNARAYKTSSFFANGYLFTLWSVIYPLSTVYLIQTATSVQTVPLEAMRRDALHLDLLHPDGCAGLARFGNLNLGLMFMFLLPVLPVVLLYFTNRRQYVSVVDTSIFFLAIVLLLSFFGLLPIARLIRSRRDGAIDSWNEKVRQLLTRRGLGSTEALVALRYRECLVAVRSFPYDKSVAHVIGILQVALALLVVLGVTESKSERLSTNSIEMPRR